MGILCWSSAHSSPDNQVAAANAAAAANVKPQQQRLQRRLRPRGMHQKQVSQVYECQRWYGVLWQAPVALLDHPGWADDKGNAVVLPVLPPGDLSGWEMVVNDATDDEGWQYGTVFRRAKEGPFGLKDELLLSSSARALVGNFC